MIYEGSLTGQGLKIGIVVSRFNDFITEKLLSGSLGALRLHGVYEADIDIVWVPGAFEIPFAVNRLASTNKYDAIITLGTVIRGATSHYDLICSEVAKGVASLSIRHQLPVLFGVLTVDTIEQAIERAGTKSGNVGWNYSVSAIEMANLNREFERKALESR